jgi:hypothetical protein
MGPSGPRRTGPPQIELLLAVADRIVRREQEAVRLRVRVVVSHAGQRIGGPRRARASLPATGDSDGVAIAATDEREPAPTATADDHDDHQDGADAAPAVACAPAVATGWRAR